MTNPILRHHRSLHVRSFLTWVGVPQFTALCLLWAMQPQNIFTATIAAIGLNAALYFFIVMIEVERRRLAAFSSRCD